MYLWIEHKMFVLVHLSDALGVHWISEVLYGRSELAGKFVAKVFCFGCTSLGSAIRESHIINK